MSLPCFFVLGNPRSGTSLYRSLLNAHPQLVVPPECGFILWLEPEWRNVDFSDPANCKGFVTAVSKARKFETWGVNAAVILGDMLAAPPNDYAEAVDRVMLTYARMRGKAPVMWGDKNNYYVTEAHRLLGVFPEAYFLHIVRDPRDVAVSYRELASRPIDSAYRPELPIDPARIAVDWCSNNRAVLDQVGHLDRYLRIRYEDLVTDVRGTMSKVFDHLGVDPGIPLSASSHLGTLDEPTSFMQWKAKLGSPVDGSSVGRFRTELGTELIDRLTAVAGGLMVELGYEPSDPLR